MGPDDSTEDVYEERIARFVELAEAAQRAADAAARVTRPNLQETYATLAVHWLALARMAQDTVELNNKKLARQYTNLSRGRNTIQSH